MTLGKTEFTVEVEETDNASENAFQKIKRLIDNDCDRVILDEKGSNQICKRTPTRISRIG